MKIYPALEKYFEDHLAEGLYLLQFRKCDKESCCVKKTKLPPPLLAPVLEPAEHHYLPFTEVYGKIATTEKDFSSLIQTAEKKKEQSVKFKLKACRVVSTLQCVQCEKRQCVFALDSRITPKNQQELEDVIFSCAMSLMGANLYTSSHFTCQSEMEIS